MKIDKESARLSRINIKLPSGATSTDALYANGRHQCAVIIELVKEVKGDNGVWSHARLTDDERSCVTVTGVTSVEHQQLPFGWSCDENRNIYDLGLWRRGAIAARQAATSDYQAPVETVVRYLRFNSGLPLESVTFVARAVLDGKVYTSHISSAEMENGSSLTITPVPPERLANVDMVPFVDHGAFRSGLVEMDVYYWTPPAGLTFLENRGLDSPITLVDEGSHFQSSFFYTGSDVPTKAGVIPGNNTFAMQLVYSDVHGKGAPANASVRFNERNTIMRAVRLKGWMRLDQGINTKTPWRLLDNFGTEHMFFLNTQDTGESITLGDLGNDAEYKIQHLHITLPGGGTSTSSLYANGRHQCKVEIEAIKEKYVPETGTWIGVPLTDAERASATVTLYSANRDQPLPAGWSCDREKNIYDSDLWNRSAIERQEQEEEPLSESSGNEVISRYMRFNSTQAIEPHRFMARIEVDGKVYTTNMKVDDVTFNAWINITPVRPYALKVVDLVEYVDYNALSDATSDVDVYYYTPPSGLRFLVNRGIDNPLAISNEGPFFQTSYINMGTGGANKNFRKGGVVMGKDVPGLRIRLNDLHQNIPWTNPYVRFHERDTIMRAVKVEAESTYTNHDSRSPWRLWDNFGCEHSFRLDWKNDGNAILLKDY